MIWCITYGNDRFEKSKHFNIKTAIEKGKADKVIAYGPEDIDSDFYAANQDILSQPRGNGYWLWKPYIILKTLNLMEEGDYLCYCDAGISYLKPVRKLIAAMEKSHAYVMPFAADLLEKTYTKRDAFIITQTDYPEAVETPQAWSGVMVYKNCRESRALVGQWLSYCRDRRVNTDDENVLGYPNYEGFIENRHDQTAFSLTCKKNNLLFFRCPFYSKKFRTPYNSWSNYGMIVYKHHRGDIGSYSELRKLRWRLFIKRIRKKLKF